MTTKETINFEGLAPHNYEVETITDGYGGFTWTNMGALDKGEYKGDPDGYEHVIHGHDGAFTYNDQVASFSSTTHFALKSGIFAAAWDTGLDVTFSGYRNGHLVAQESVTLDQAADTIRFNSAFKNLDTVTISTSGGTDENSGDAGSGQHVAIDNLKVIFKGAIPTDAVADHSVSALAHNSGLHEMMSGRDFAIAHPLHDWIMM